MSRWDPVRTKDGVEPGWVVDQPVWGTRLTAAISMAGLVAGIWMTIASGGHADTPLIAVGPIVLLFGLFIGYFSLAGRHSQVKVGDGSYTTRGGVPSKTKTLQFCDVQMIRGGAGETLRYLVVTDRLGQRMRIGLQLGPAEMRQYVAANLLSSGADIDPECSDALQQLAGEVKPVNAGPAADPFIRLDSHDRLRWPRGTALSLFAGAVLTLLGVFWLVAAAPGVPRWVGLPLLAVGIIRVALPLWGRHIDQGKHSEHDTR
jgi:hypothetical protein